MICPKTNIECQCLTPCIDEVYTIFQSQIQPVIIDTVYHLVFIQRDSLHEYVIEMADRKRDHILLSRINSTQKCTIGIPLSKFEKALKEFNGAWYCKF